MRVVVVGAGVAGVAAAVALTAAGAQVEVVAEDGGASSLTSGAVDWTAWMRPSAPPARAGRLQELLSSLAAELGWQLGERELVTGAGLIRPAAGSDRWLLSLGAAERTQPIGVLATNWAFDAGARLLRALQGDPRAAGRTFVAVDAGRLFAESEERLPLPALLAAFSEERAGSLLQVAERAHQSGIGALLTGPYLGGHPAALTKLERAPIPIGETTSPPDGSAGVRSSLRLEEVLRRRGIALSRARVDAVRLEDSGVVLDVVERAGAQRQLEADRVVVATGGLIGGGLALGVEPGGAIDSPLVESTSDSGSRLGWDAAADGGSWLRPGLGPGLPRELGGGRIVAVGDVRAGAEQTLASALLDGLSAALGAESR